VIDSKTPDHTDNHASLPGRRADANERDETRLIKPSSPNLQHFQAGRYVKICALFERRQHAQFIALGIEFK